MPDNASISASSSTRAVRPPLLVVLGPTAGGKSELAVRLSEALAARGGVGEILSADSMQVYRHMDAGTAKPSPDQQRRAKHHLVDIVEPTERFTVADWLSRADTLIKDLQAAGSHAIVVGGTNLYMKALLEGLFEGPPQDPAFRAKAEKRPGHELHAELQAVDPPSAARIHINDHKKLVRALEVFHVTGKPISSMQTQWKADVQPINDDGRGHAKPKAGEASLENDPVAKPLPHGRGSFKPYRYDAILFRLDWPVDQINQRINARVKAMFFPDKVDPAIAAEVTPKGESIIDEVARLESAELLGQQAREALGYKQVLEHLAGELSLDEVFEKTKILTRRFAKTQRTWLKRFRGVHSFDPTAMAWEDVVEQAVGVVVGERH